MGGGKAVALSHYGNAETVPLRTRDPSIDPLAELINVNCIRCASLPSFILFEFQKPRTFSRTSPRKNGVFTTIFVKKNKAKSSLRYSR